MSVLCGSGRCFSLVQICTKHCEGGQLTLVLGIGAVLVICQSPGQTSWRRCVAMNGCVREVERLNVGPLLATLIACPKFSSSECNSRDECNFSAKHSAMQRFDED